MKFGTKLSVSLIGKGLVQVEAYKKRYGYYLKVVIAGTLYGSRDNRSYLERNHIRFAGKPLGRPLKITPESSVNCAFENTTPTGISRAHFN